jgi:penicillin-binding protein 1A
MADTQYKLLPRETRTAMRPDLEDGDLGTDPDSPDLAGGIYGGSSGNRRAGPDSDLLDPFGERRSRRAQGETYQPWPGTQRSPFGDEEEVRPRPRRRDPDYLFGDDPPY